MLAALLVVCGLAAPSLELPHSPEAANYIVQAETFSEAARAVAQVGGSITHELEIIDAVGATLSPRHVLALERLGDSFRAHG